MRNVRAVTWVFKSAISVFREAMVVSSVAIADAPSVDDLNLIVYRHVSVESAA